jgi:hypothetical protein
MSQSDIAALFKEARTGKTMREVAAEADVGTGTLVQLEREGIFPGMRIYDVLKLVRYYGVDIRTVLQMLGYGDLIPDHQ